MLDSILVMVGSTMITISGLTIIYLVSPLSDIIPLKKFAIGLGLLTMAVIFFAVQTFGPRNSLHSERPQVNNYVPDATEIPAESEPLIRKSDRVGQFDDAIGDD